MVTHILRGLPQGSAVHVTNRDVVSAAAAIAAGATWHETAREVGAESDVVILMVPDLPDVRMVLEGEDGLLADAARPMVISISSTVSPQGVRDLGTELQERTGGRVRLVDAPVSGGEEGAVAGKLSVMVGGASDDVKLVLPLYETMGTPLHLGPLGAGQVAKACNQMIIAAEVAAIAEAAVMAERAGIDVLQLFDLLQQGFAGSRVLEVKKERFANHDHSPSGPARFMIKDLTFATQEARQSSTPTPQTDLLLKLFTDLTAEGYGDFDTAVVQAYLEAHDRSEGGTQ